MFVILLLTVVGGALLDIPCMVFHRMCVCCSCGPSEHLDAPSICCVFVCRKLSPHLGVFESWITGVFSSYDVSLCDLAYYVLG